MSLKPNLVKWVSAVKLIARDKGVELTQMQVNEVIRDAENHLRVKYPRCISRDEHFALSIKEVFEERLDRMSTANLEERAMFPSGYATPKTKIDRDKMQLNA